MADTSWYHTIEMPDGTATPGHFDTRQAPRHVPWPVVDGKRCLDVGTFDGFWAFEMERMGASEVVAIDVDDPDALDWPYDSRTRGPEEMRKWRSERGPGFFTASERLGSQVKRINTSVYDLDPAVVGTFDIVFCGALLLHLRDPALALERMRGVCGGSLVLVEQLDPALELLAPRVASARLILGVDQWWNVNSAGLAGLVYKSGFAVQEMGKRFIVPFGAGGAGIKPSRIHSIAARRPREPGVLFRALRATPRPPTNTI